jgi:hypothetical protein
MEWFAVRHIIENDGSFEERITLWRSPSEAEAMTRAEKEAAEYVATVGGNVLGLFQSYRVGELPTDGSEVFSLIRRSDLPSARYLDAFFDTGSELQRSD